MFRSRGPLSVQDHILITTDLGCLKQWSLLVSVREVTCLSHIRGTDCPDWGFPCVSSDLSENYRLLPQIMILICPSEYPVIRHSVDWVIGSVVRWTINKWVILLLYASCYLPRYSLLFISLFLLTNFLFHFFLLISLMSVFTPIPFFSYIFARSSCLLTSFFLFFYFYSPLSVSSYPSKAHDLLQPILNNFLRDFRHFLQAKSSPLLWIGHDHFFEHPF